MPAPTLEVFAEHLNLTPVPLPAEDARRPELQRHLDAAIGVVERRCGPLDATERTYRARNIDRTLILPVTRLAALVSVTDPTGAAADIPPAGRNLHAGVLTLPYRSDGEWTVVAKRADAGAPSDLEMAVYIVAGHLYETQRARSARPQQFGDAPGPVAGVPRGFAIPHRAATLMEPFLLPDGPDVQAGP